MGPMGPMYSMKSMIFWAPRPSTESVQSFGQETYWKLDVKPMDFFRRLLHETHCIFRVKYTQSHKMGTAGVNKKPSDVHIPTLPSPPDPAHLVVLAMVVMVMVVVLPAKSS